MTKPTLALIGLVSTLAAWAPQRVWAADPPAEALIYSTMPSTPAHRPEMAMDGDVNTYFRSAYGVSGGDSFMVLLSRPIPVTSLHVVTGDADGQDGVTDGAVETGTDPGQFSPAATFDAKGVADAKLDGKLVGAVRIHVNRRRGVPALLVREITIDSPVKIDHVQMGPGRGFHDISQAPDVADWAKRAERQMEDFWPDTEALLYSDNFIPPNAINVVYRTGPGVTGVAATGGGVMTVNTAWCHQHPDDTGLTVHEDAHVIQAYSAYNPVWLVEGIADYIRWVRFEPQNQHARINVNTATYHDSYRTTATFLGWCELHYDSRLVTKLSQEVRYNRYKNDLFKQYCGKDVDTLWAEFIAAYKADYAHILTPVVAEADRPRVLPVVAAGASVPVEVKAAFNTTGFYAEGATYNPAGGIDGEGDAFAAKFLGATQTWKNVQFNLGPAGAPNVVTPHGQVLPLPAGNYNSLWLLGTGVEGSQKDQKFVVTYADGSTTNLLQSFSDWYEPQNFPGESRAITMPERIAANGAIDPRDFHVYSYGFALDGTKAVKSLTLPDNQYVKILAVSVAK